MKKKIALITDLGFQKKEFDRFFIHELSKEFDIFVFDFTKTFNPPLYKIVKKKQIKLKNFYEVSDFKNFEKFFLINKFFTTIHSVANYELILKINNFFKNNSLSSTGIQNHQVMQVKKNIIQKIYNFFFALLDKKRILGKIRYLSFKNENTFFLSNIFVCGLKGCENLSIGPKTKIIKAHSREYDVHISSKFDKNSIKNKGKYAVFLDQYLPFHTDGTLFKKFNAKVTKEKYFPALNDFFSTFEEYTKTKVIIAAHPKSNYDRAKKNFWYGRNFYKDKTYELIKNSSYVLAHQSTSISFAVILKKPIIFLTSKEYMKSYDSFTVHGYAKYFKQPIFNIDNFKKDDFNKSLKKIDRKIYKEFFNNYIKYPGSPDIKLNKIFINYFFKKLNNFRP
jgi:hypothetical protein